MEFLQYDDCKGYRIVPFNLKVLAKFGLCSNCSQKFDECSLARARQIFATARMLGFSLKFSVRVVEADNLHLAATEIDAGNNISRMGKLGNIGETCTRCEDDECFWKNASNASGNR